MVVWFKHGSCTVGVADGLIRSADFAALTSLQQAAQAVQGEREQALADVQAQGQQLLEAARSQAQAWLALAQQELDGGYQAGLAQGSAEAANLWAEQALLNARSHQQALERQRERLGGIVAMAVERLVEQEDKQALFKRALRTIGKLIKDVPMLTLRVNEADHDAAKRALLAMVDQASGVVPIELVSDAGLAGGSCRFESDNGVIDAGLATQLAAIKRAVVRAALVEPIQQAA
jgi:type III secretion protein L